MVACTNQKAAGEGAGTGGTVYTDYVQFDVNNMYCFLGVLFANGLALKPDITRWFESTASDELLGNNFIAPQMNKKCQEGELSQVFNNGSIYEDSCVCMILEV